MSKSIAHIPQQTYQIMNHSTLSKTIKDSKTPPMQQKDKNTPKTRLNIFLTHLFIKTKNDADKLVSDLPDHMNHINLFILLRINLFRILISRLSHRNIIDLFLSICIHRTTMDMYIQDRIKHNKELRQLQTQLTHQH